MTIELPMDKRQRILVTLKAFKASNKVSIRYLAEVIGILVSACPAVRYRWLHIKNLERLRYLALLRNNNNFEAVVELSVLANIDLSWWTLLRLVGEVFVANLKFTVGGPTMKGCSISIFWNLEQPVPFYAILHPHFQTLQYCSE